MFAIVSAVSVCADLVPEGLRPLQQTYVSMLQRREPALAAAWQQRVRAAETSSTVSSRSAVSEAEAVAGGAAATSRAVVQLWRELAETQRHGGGPTQHRLQTWAQFTAQQKRRPNNQTPNPKP